MKIDLDTSNLDWTKASVMDFRYIHHLREMVLERMNFGGAFGFFNYNDYFPFGLFNFQQILMIYKAMLWMGTSIFFNRNNFDEKYWHNSNNLKLWCYTLKDMCEIAEFDFFANPLIPRTIFKLL